MQSIDNPDLILNNLQNTNKYSKNMFANLLKYMEKIKSVSDYDEYKKKFIIIPLFDFFIDCVLLCCVIFVMLIAMSGFISMNPLFNFSMAVGITLFLKLIIHIKQELWRRTD